MTTYQTHQRTNRINSPIYSITSCTIHSSFRIAFRSFFHRKPAIRSPSYPPRATAKGASSSLSCLRADSLNRPCSPERNVLQERVSQPRTVAGCRCKAISNPLFLCNGGLCRWKASPRPVNYIISTVRNASRGNERSAN